MECDDCQLSWLCCAMSVACSAEDIWLVSPLQGGRLLIISIPLSRCDHVFVSSGD